MLLLFSLQLLACGFHLRGDNQVADHFNPLFVEAGQLDSAQVFDIRKELIRSSARLTALTQHARRLLVVIDPLKRRRLAGSSVSDIEIIQLMQKLQFSVLSATGETLLAERKLVQKVDIELDNANVLGHKQIIANVQQRLQRDLIRNMVSQLSR